MNGLSRNFKGALNLAIASLRPEDEVKRMKSKEKNKYLNYVAVCFTYLLRDRVKIWFLLYK